MDKAEDDRRHQEPPPTGEQPGDQAVAPPETLVPGLVEPVQRQPGGGEDGPVERHALTQPFEQRRQGAGRVAPGELDHGRGGQRIRRLGRRLTAPEGVVEADEIRHRATGDGEIQIEHSEALPLARGPAA